MEQKEKINDDLPSANLKSLHNPVVNKQVFLLVCGLFPQVITETIYAFYVHEKMDPTIPAEIYVITTLEGANNARLQLLAPNTNYFAKLKHEYGLNHIHFDESSIFVIEDDRGMPLDDIRTPEQNTQAANFINQKVQYFTNDEHSALHVSLAGGRKTMGYYVGYALSLYGRSQDSLSHVLVSDAFEGNRDFFFPTKETHIIYGKNQEPLDTSDAKVQLAKIPFVRLREELPEEFLRTTRAFDETVRMINSSHEAPRLVLDIQKKKVYCNGFEIKLSLIEFCYFLWFAHLKLNDKLPLEAPSVYQLSYDVKPDSGVKTLNQLYGAELKTLLLEHNIWDELMTRSQNALEKGIDREALSIKLSELSKSLRQSLNQTLAKSFTPYMFKDSKKWFLDLPIDKMHVEIKN